MKQFILGATMICAAFAASATNFGNTENNYDQRNYGGNTTNQGGQGGAGGSANAGAVAGAAAGASASVDSKNSNSNLNANNNSVKSENTNVAAQGQKQGQAQTQSAKSNQTQSNQSSNRIEGGNGAGNQTNVAVAGDVYQAQERNPVSTAYAAPLTSSNGTCMGSSSVGGQGASFGLSIGSTWTDSGCDARYDATALVQAGQAKAAIARLCLKAEIKQAMKDAGTPCQGDASGSTKKAEAEPTQQVATYQDPIIRARLGLPPLK